MIAIRSAIAIASSWSCVTRTVVTWTSSCRRRSHSRSGADLGVERAERLVEQQHTRLDGERAGQRHALALTAGELARVALVVARQPDDAEQLVDTRARAP